MRSSSLQSNAFLKCLPSSFECLTFPFSASIIFSRCRQIFFKRLSSLSNLSFVLFVFSLLRKIITTPKTTVTTPRETNTLKKDCCSLKLNMIDIHAMYSVFAFPSPSYAPLFHYFCQPHYKYTMFNFYVKFCINFLFIFLLFP